MPIQSRVREMTQSELKALKSALIDRQPLPFPADSSDAAVAELHEMLLELRNFTSALAGGNLSQPLEYKGCMATALKSLQANLRQLSLQTRQQSQGDFAYQSDFMDDVTASFNSMTQQLKDAKDQLAEANQILQLRLDTDALTGLYNYSFLMNTLENEIERSRRYDTPLSIVEFDIDHFKKLNDTFGYRVGDAVLEKTAVLMRQILRPSDTAGRYGSGEFMLILPNTDCAGACALAERVQSLIAATPFTEANISVTISAGIATWEKQKLVDLIHAADDNLYDAKKQEQ